MTKAYIVYHKEHDSFRDEISNGLADDLYVRIRQVSYGFHLTLHLRIKGANFTLLWKRQKMTSIKHVHGNTASN